MPTNVTPERVLLWIAQINDEEFTAMTLQTLHKYNYPYKSSDTSAPIHD